MIRFLLVVLCLAAVAVAVAAMRAGWRNRARSQSYLPPVPDVPGGLGAPLAPVLRGLYVGTVFAPSWQDRVVHGGLGLRAETSAVLHPQGVRVERVGAPPVFIPAGAVSGVRLESGLAGKVVGAGGLLVIDWRLGDAALATGLRADDKSVYPEWVRLLSAASDGRTQPVTASSASPGNGIRHSTGERGLQ